MLQNHQPISRAYLGAGARDGDRRAAMAAAARLLERAEVAIERASALYETEPVDLPGKRPLLNGVLAVSTRLGPAGLWRACREIEIRLGRKRARPDHGAPDPGPRPIDLDLLLYGDRIIDSPDLIVPHPRLHRRRFVLVPMVEIAPELLHPVLGRDMRTLLDECRDRCWVRPLHPPDEWWSGGVSH